MKILGNAPLHGVIDAIPSKSYAHRALICAALSDRPSTVYFTKSSEDIDATAEALRQMGAEIRERENGRDVIPIQKKKGVPCLDMGESGSTFRFLLPVAATLYDKSRFVGRGRLPERPIGELIRVLEEGGCVFSDDRLPFEVTGRYEGQSCRLPGDVSSQYVSGMFFAAPLLPGDFEVFLTSELESRGYVEMTREVLDHYGIRVAATESGYHVERGTYRGKDFVVEGDWSNAAFFLVAGALGQGVSVGGLNLRSSQGDRKIVEILREWGASIREEEGSLRICGGEFRPFHADLREIPDALPILAVAAAAVPEGASRFTNGKRLRLKESDRLSTVAELITRLGGRVEEKEDGLVVYGTGGLAGGEVSSFGDHRLAMAAAVAATICKSKVTLRGAEAVAKSYPEFFDDFQKLGGEVHDSNLRE